MLINLSLLLNNRNFVMSIGYNGTFVECVYYTCSRSKMLAIKRNREERCKNKNILISQNVGVCKGIVKSTPLCPISVKAQQKAPLISSWNTLSDEILSPSNGQTQCCYLWEAFPENLKQLEASISMFQQHFVLIIIVLIKLLQFI